jgi:phage/plasmid-like protein (TIGR03299 family)
MNMPHAVEVSRDGEKQSFASFREPAWHGLGTVFFEEKSTQEMLDAAYLSNWNVRLEAVPYPKAYNVITPSYMVLRDNPFDQGTDVLATVGERYHVLQNEDLFNFGDALLDGGRWETAGSIRQGRVVFGSLALERETVLDPNGVSDVVKSYLLVHTSHDGSTAVQASITPVRVVCQNTLNMALQGVKQSFKIRHTQTVGGKVQAAREALSLANQYLDTFDKEAQALIAKEITKAKFDAIVEAVYPRPDKDAKGAVKKWETKVDLLEEIYSSDTTNMIAGTAWGAFNALTERLDWFRKGRGERGAENVAAAASGFDPVTNAEKGRILKAVKEIAFA